jgi:hypothetical protein
MAAIVSSPLSMIPSGVTVWSFPAACSKVATTSCPPMPPDFDADAMASDPGVNTVPFGGASLAMSKPGAAGPFPENDMPMLNEARVVIEVTGWPS